MRRRNRAYRRLIALALAGLVLMHGLALAAAPLPQRRAGHELKDPAPVADALALPGAKESPRAEAPSRLRLPPPDRSVGRLAMARQHPARRPAPSPPPRARSHAIHHRVRVADDPPH